MGIDTLLRIGQKVLVFGVFIGLVYTLTDMLISGLTGYLDSVTPCMNNILVSVGFFVALQLYLSILIGGFISRRVLDYLANL